MDCNKIQEGNNNPVTFMVTFMTYFSITLDLYIYIYCTWTLAFRSIKPVNLSIFIYIYQKQDIYYFTSYISVSSKPSNVWKKAKHNS